MWRMRIREDKLGRIYKQISLNDERWRVNTDWQDIQTLDTDILSLSLTRYHIRSLKWRK